MTHAKDEKWWTDTTDKVHTKVVEVAATIRKHDSRVQRLRQWRLLYLSGSITDAETTTTVTDASATDYASYNVVREAIDTMHAKMAKSRPRAWIVTDGGSWELQDRSKLLTTWVAGEFERLNTYPMNSDVLLDACVYGCGAIKHSVGPDGRPASELSYVGNLAVDPREERLRHVRTLYEVRNVDKLALAEIFPKKKAEIMALEANATDPEEQPNGGVADLVTVTEAWRLGVGDKPGRHVIAIAGVTLGNEEWPANQGFPFSFLHYSRDPRRFFGIGLCERLFGAQSDLNHLSDQITKSFRTWVQHMFIDANSGLSVDEFSNEIGSIHFGDFAGKTPPYVLAPSAIGSDWISYQQYLADRMLQGEGISVLAARSEKPAGLNSGKALIVHQDVESERHMVFSRAFEQLHVDCAKQLLISAEVIVKGDKEYKQKLRALGGKRTLEVVCYSDARMDSDEYLVKVQPASSLSSTPAGKLQEIQGLIDMQVITDPDAIRELLDFPDLDAYNDVESAGRNVARKLIDAASRGKQVEAIEELPLEWAVKQCKLRICLAGVEGKPESKISQLRNLLGQLTNLVDLRDQAEAAAQQAAMPPPPPAGPPALPGGGIPMDMGMGAPPMPGPGMMPPPLEAV